MACFFTQGSPRYVSFDKKFKEWVWLCRQLLSGRWLLFFQPEIAVSWLVMFFLSAVPAFVLMRSSWGNICGPTGVTIARTNPLHTSICPASWALALQLLNYSTLLNPITHFVKERNSFFFTFTLTRVLKKSLALASLTKVKSDLCRD